MNGVVLDTNALLWTLTDDGRLGPESRDLMTSAPDVWFSSVNILELTIKTMLGRLGGPVDWAPAARSLGLRDLPFDSAHAGALSTFPDLARHDPFDRMLLTQASSEGAALLTADRVLLGLVPDLTVDARR